MREAFESGADLAETLDTVASYKNARIFSGAVEFLRQCHQAMVDAGYPPRVTGSRKAAEFLSMVPAEMVLEMNYAQGSEVIEKAAFLAASVEAMRHKINLVPAGFPESPMLKAHSYGAYHPALIGYDDEDED